MIKTYKPRPREAVLELIEAYIMEKGLQQNDKLPPERAMCEMWGINRATLRSAIARLVAEGRLYTREGSAIRLSRRVERTLQDLQGFQEYALTHGMTPESRLLSSSLVKCDKQLAKRFDISEDDMLYRIVRLRILDKTPVLLETAYIPQSLAPGLDENDLVNGSLFSVLKNQYGLELENGWEKTSITYATPEEAEYLNIAEGAPVFWIVSQTHGKDGALIEYCRSLGRADVMALTSTLYLQEGQHDQA